MASLAGRVTPVGGPVARLAEVQRGWGLAHEAAGPGPAPRGRRGWLVRPGLVT